MQKLMVAKRARLEQLQAIEENTSRLCSARQQLVVWLRENEGRAGQVQDCLTPDDVIVATDQLSEQAMHAQVRVRHRMMCTHLPPGLASVLAVSNVHFCICTRDLFPSICQPALALQPIEIHHVCTSSA